MTAGGLPLERLIRTGLLYDFYGGLLTDKQRKALELYYYEDWTLAEIAAEEMVSRQAIHDLIHRSERIMEEYETKLGLMERFLTQQDILKKMSKQLDQLIQTIPEGQMGYKELINIKSQISQLTEE